MELTFFREEENKILKEKLEQFEAVNMNFANFLKKSEWKSTMDENRILIHIKSGDIFFEKKMTFTCNKTTKRNY